MVFFVQVDFGLFFARVPKLASLRSQCTSAKWRPNNPRVLNKTFLKRVGFLETDVKIAVTKLTPAKKGEQKTHCTTMSNQFFKFKKQAVSPVVEQYKQALKATDVAKVKQMRELLMPAKSQGTYDKQFEVFCNWAADNHYDEVSEESMILYVHHLKFVRELGGRTVLSYISQIGKRLLVEEAITDKWCREYPILAEICYELAQQKKPKKAEVFTLSDCINYIKKAQTTCANIQKKMALRFGNYGGTRTKELWALKFEDIMERNHPVRGKYLQVHTNLFSNHLLTIA